MKKGDGVRRGITRRGFLESGAAAASFTVLSAGLARGSQANSKLKLGMIGCGSRGNWIGNLFKQHGGYEMHAAADYFQDRVDGYGEKFGVPAERRFTGLNCYKKLLDSGVDCVAIESPPYFHPEQALASVEAGVHTYVAKPIAVDTPGCNTIGEAGEKAAGKLCLLVDFQTRANKYYIEALKRVHNGALGRITFAESWYHAGDPFGRMYKHLKGGASAEDKLRAWGVFQSYSGDIITEQNVHTLDVQSWIMGEPPVRCSGNGDQWMRPHGDCYDTFQAFFEYPNDVGVTFSSRQMPGHGTQPAGIRNRVFGTQGVLEAQYGGEVRILAGEKNFYKGGRTGSIFKEGAVNNIAAFHKNILEGNFENPTVEPSIQSTLHTFMARRAAYTGETVTWEEIANSKERMHPPLDGLKA